MTAQINEKLTAFCRRCLKTARTDSCSCESPSIARHEELGALAIAQSRQQRRAQHRPLRVGFISGYFHHQAVAYFLTPLLKARGADWQAYCYAGGRESDAYTAAFAAL